MKRLREFSIQEGKLSVFTFYHYKMPAWIQIWNDENLNKQNDLILLLSSSFCFKTIYWTNILDCKVNCLFYHYMIFRSKSVIMIVDLGSLDKTLIRTLKNDKNKDKNTLIILIIHSTLYMYPNILVRLKK